MTRVIQLQLLINDNVGDVAGMGADLFGSYVATVLAMVLGTMLSRIWEEE
jgi:Na+/H+-translocating membrane pyrophosphatase